MQAHLEAIMKKMKYAILDLDGTLLDSMPVWVDLDKSVLEPMGIIVDDNLNKRFKTMTLQQSSAYLTERFALNLTADELMKIFADTIVSSYQEEVPLKPGALEFLQFLRQNHIAACVATASEKELAAAALQRTGALAYLDFILTCSDLGTSKENPKIYTEAMKRLGGNADNTVVFEDACLSVLSAKKAGLSVIGVYEACMEDSQNELRALSDGYIRSFYELL